MSFCSREAVAAHEALAGTGVRADAYVFAPVAKRFWGESEMNTAWASVQELEAIRAGRRGGAVTRLYQPPRGAEDQPAPVLVYLSPDAPRPVALDGLLEVLGRRWPVDESGAPRVAICTHGTRDRCCAKWGFAAYTAARKLHEEGRSPFAPIETSHLGGDRFAATGIFFPSGGMYAHLDSLDLEGLAAAEDAGRLDPTHYRGRVFESPLTQVVRAGLASQGLFDGTTPPLKVERLSADRVRARVGDAVYDVTLGVREVRFFGSCTSLAQQKDSHAERTVYVSASLAA